MTEKFNIFTLTKGGRIITKEFRSNGNFFNNVHIRNEASGYCNLQVQKPATVAVVKYNIYGGLERIMSPAGDLTEKALLELGYWINGVKLQKVPADYKDLLLEEE